MSNNADAVKRRWSVSAFVMGGRLRRAVRVLPSPPSSLSPGLAAAHFTFTTFTTFTRAGGCAFYLHHLHHFHLSALVFCHTAFSGDVAGKAGERRRRGSSGASGDSQRRAPSSVRGLGPGQQGIHISKAMDQMFGCQEPVWPM